MTSLKFWDGSQWIELGSVPGPPGSQGVQGVQGVQGATGPPAAVVQPGTPTPRGETVLWIDTDDVPYPASPIPVVTTLPSNPLDGQEVYYVTPVPNARTFWHLRYDDTWYGVDGYGWVFMGGSPLYAEVAGESLSYTNNAWGNFPTDPSFTLPLAGSYIADANTAMSVATTCTMWMGISVASVIDPTGGVNYYSEAGHVTGGSVLYHRRQFIGAAGNVVRPQFKHNSGGNNNLSRNLITFSLLPLRVKK